MYKEQECVVSHIHMQKWLSKHNLIELKKSAHSPIFLLSNYGSPRSEQTVTDAEIEARLRSQDFCNLLIPS